MSDINERIRKILNTRFSGNVSEMARKSKVPQPTLNNIVGNRMSKPSFENLEKLLNSDETIDAGWLLTGKGEMTKNSANADEAGYKEKYFKLMEEKNELYKKYTEALEELREMEREKNIHARTDLDVPDAI